MTKPINIALYFYSLLQAGGAERMICQLANAMTERGKRVFLVTWDQADASSYYPLHPSVQWLRLGFSHGITDKLRRTKNLYHAIKNHHINILTGFVMSADKTVYAAVRMAGIRLVVAERNAPDMYWLRYTWCQRQTAFMLMHLADCITIQSPAFREKYPKSLQHRIQVIPNPVAAAPCKAAPGTANTMGRYVLLAVSRLDKTQKRLDLLLHAFVKLSHKYPQWDLRIIGDGPEKETLRGIIEQNRLTHRISLEASTPDILAVYTQCHLFVIPSLWEGFPNALAEAMSHGLPAVGFREAAGVAELIEDHGWLADGLGNEKALANALELGMSSHLERSQKGLAAAEKMTLYAPNIQFDCWDALFNSLAG